MDLPADNYPPKKPRGTREGRGGSQEGLNACEAKERQGCGAEVLCPKVGGTSYCSRMHSETAPADCDVVIVSEKINKIRSDEDSDRVVAIKECQGPVLRRSTVLGRTPRLQNAVMSIQVQAPCGIGAQTITYIKPSGAGGAAAGDGSIPAGCRGERIGSNGNVKVVYDGTRWLTALDKEPAGSGGATPDGSPCHLQDGCVVTGDTDQGPALSCHSHASGEGSLAAKDKPKADEASTHGCHSRLPAHAPTVKLSTGAFYGNSKANGHVTRSPVLEISLKRLPAAPQQCHTLPTTNAPSRLTPVLNSKSVQPVTGSTDDSCEGNRTPHRKSSPNLFLNRRRGRLRRQLDVPVTVVLSSDDDSEEDPDQVLAAKSAVTPAARTGQLATEEDLFPQGHSQCPLRSTQQTLRRQQSLPAAKAQRRGSSAACGDSDMDSEYSQEILDLAATDVHLGTLPCKPIDNVELSVDRGIILNVVASTDGREIKLRIDSRDIVECRGYFSKTMALMFVSTNPSFGLKIRQKLCMTDPSLSYFDPHGKGEGQRYITIRLDCLEISSPCDLESKVLDLYNKISVKHKAGQAIYKPLQLVEVSKQLLICEQDINAALRLCAAAERTNPRLPERSEDAGTRVKAAKESCTLVASAGTEAVQQPTAVKALGATGCRSDTVQHTWSTSSLSDTAGRPSGAACCISVASTGSASDSSITAARSTKNAVHLTAKDCNDGAAIVVTTKSPALSLTGSSAASAEPQRSASPSSASGSHCESPVLSGPVQRLFMYPFPRVVGSIAVTSDDVLCLEEGEFLNDVIVDFYLKYLTEERLSHENRKRTHIFSSFFYMRLTQNPASSHGRYIEEGFSTMKERRHNRVKTWTRHVDIFDKDFLIVPINEKAHWFLAIICFPSSLKSLCKDAFTSPTEAQKNENLQQQQQDIGDTARVDVITSTEEVCDENSATLARDVSQQRSATDATSDTSDDVTDGQMPAAAPLLSLPRPCILIFDSLSGSPRAATMRILREYLEMEWNTRKRVSNKPASPSSQSVFTKQTIPGSSPSCPQQDNYCDCGIFLLQYVESFFENPIKDYTLPIQHLDDWFSLDRVRRKRQEIIELVKHIQSNYEQSRHNAT